MSGSAYRYWRVLAMQTTPQTSTPGQLELSELQLWAAGVRVDGPATLTASAAPSSGSLASLKDNSASSGVYWSSNGGDVVLTWQFSAAVAVDAVVLGSRTTAARWPFSLSLQGGPDGVRWPLVHAISCGPFASAALTPQRPAVGALMLQPKWQGWDFLTPSGKGRIPYVVKREVLPRTTPPTKVPAWAKVRLERDMDGRVVQEQWCDPVTGAGSFEQLDENFEYTLTAIFPESGMRAVIADRVRPEGYPS